MSSYRIVRNAAVWWPVKWNEAIDGGRVIERRIELRFVRVGNEEAKTIFDMENRAFLDRVATDWRGVADEDGQPVPFTDRWKDEWLQLPNVPEALGLAYLLCRRAEPETRQGNSAPSPAGGPAGAAETADPTAITTP